MSWIYHGYRTGRMTSGENLQTLPKDPNVEIESKPVRITAAFPGADGIGADVEYQEIEDGTTEE